MLKDGMSRFRVAEEYFSVLPDPGTGAVLSREAGA
jgi:hypothetical protein